MAALIFDFDGVIADSEALANAVLAAFVMESELGRPLPADFSHHRRAATLNRFRKDLTEVRGATDFIRRFSAHPRCIASSSSIDRLQLCLSVLDLDDSFGGNVFSADRVRRGKPLREAGATHLAGSWEQVATFAELFLERASGLRV